MDTINGTNAIIKIIKIASNIAILSFFMVFVSFKNEGGHPWLADLCCPFNFSACISLVTMKWIMTLFLNVVWFYRRWFYRIYDYKNYCWFIYILSISCSFSLVCFRFLYILYFAIVSYYIYYSKLIYRFIHAYFSDYWYTFI